MRSGKLKNGFEYKFDEGVMNDMEFLDALYESQGKAPLRISEVITKLLGEEQKQALYDYVRDKETGRVSPEKITECLTEIFEGSEDSKNS